ncbi:hypothetical protein V2J09_023584 [Rumex salicifolius]
MELAAGNWNFPVGARFHPTDAELVVHYLKRKLLGMPLDTGFVVEVDIYKFHPEDLKEMAYFTKELIWYFFCAIGNKYSHGERKSRSTHCGYWKPTGNDRIVSDHQGRTVGKIKTLVFYQGKPANGEKTNWVMYEYRLEDGELANNGRSVSVVLCKIFKKGGSLSFGAPYIEEENNALEPIAVQVQSASVVMNENDSVSADAKPLHTTTEKVCSGAVSLYSGVYQPPTPTSNGVNVSSFSNGGILDASHINLVAGSDVASSSRGPVPNLDVSCPDSSEEIYKGLGLLPILAVTGLTQDN